MPFIDGQGFIFKKNVTKYNYKDYAVEVLEEGEDTIALFGVNLTDRLQVFDHYGLLWTEGEHYERTGANGENIVFDPPTEDEVTFTIFIFSLA